VKHEQGIDCGGGYLKILPSTLDQKHFNGESAYNIMFGPDICGPTRKVHVIFNYNGKNHLINKEIHPENNEYTHLYTLILHPDNTYEVQIDQKEVAKGSLKEDWDLLEPKTINDPEASKPADWVDEKEIEDPEAKKPEGYDDIPKNIADPDATKPEDWDDELDGEWEAPTIHNPAWKGPWRAKKIPNPAYQGPWVHPQVPNPAYQDNDELYVYEDNGALGFELWQVKSGTIFDNIILTDSIDEAKAHADATWAKTAPAEKDAHEAQELKEKEEREKKYAEEEGQDEEEEEEAKEKDEL